MSELTPDEIKSLAARIDALESRLAFQDDTIETLNKTVTAQWLQIDALKRKLAQLDERLQEAETESSGVNEPPPHY